MFENKEGLRIPDLTFRIREKHSWILKSSDDFFLNKRVIVFAFPESSTPICSTLHLPSYNDLYDTFRAAGIDDVYCLAMSDSFVLEAWKKAEKADKITMLPDVEGEFSKKLGIPIEKARYSMVVNDRVIEKIFSEDIGVDSDPYGESGVEKMLHYLDPMAKLPDFVAIFTKHGCAECEDVKDILKSNYIPFDEMILNEQFTIKTVKALSGSTYLPQVFVNGKKLSIQELRKHYQSLKLAS